MNKNKLEFHQTLNKIETEIREVQETIERLMERLKRLEQEKRKIKSLLDK
ncbi:MAG: hypothetical protein LCH81_15795 [Bacteroidetes bacterium]|nr:hypothetical protein [Bacteroidota bacterium]